MISKHHAGFSLMELIAVVAIIAGLTIAIGFAINAANTTADRNVAIAEVQMLISSSAQFRKVNRGIYDDGTTQISIAQLVSNGYPTGGIATGTGDNAFGLDVTLAGTAAAACSSSNICRDAKLVYSTPDATQCGSLAELFTSGGFIKTAGSCSASNLEVVIE